MSRKAAARGSDTSSFRGLVRQLVESKGYVKAAQVKDALAATDPKQYGALRPSQETTIYQVLKDLGHGRGTKGTRKASPIAAPVLGLAELIENAEPEQLRRHLDELKERKAKLDRAIRALELLLGDST